jgi:hypothetical protein
MPNERCSCRHAVSGPARLTAQAPFRKCIHNKRSPLIRVHRFNHRIQVFWEVKKSSTLQDMLPEDAGNRMLEISVPVYQSTRHGLLQGRRLDTQRSNEAQIPVFSLFRTVVSSVTYIRGIFFYICTLVSFRFINQ